MQSFYNNTAINLSVPCLFTVKEKVLMLLLLSHFSHNVAISLNFIDAAISSVVNRF